MDFSTRISLLQQTLSAHTALLVSDPAHLFYLTGIMQLNPEEKEGFLIVSDQYALCILTPFAPLPQISNLETKHLSSSSPFSSLLKEWCVSNKIKTLQIDTGTLFVSEYEVIKKNLEHVHIESLTEDPIDELRMSKSDEELIFIKKANHLTHQALKYIQSQCKKDVTEKQLKLLVENFLRKKGVEQMAFPTIIAFGEHTALPHHQPTNRKLKNNEPVLIDIGAKWNGYCADVTRTWWFGDTASQQFVEIERIIKKAYDATLQLCSSVASKAKPLTAKDLDNTARAIITDAGYGSQFIHTTGHGVGIVIHEPPSLNWKNETILKPGFVITIEPGIYLPNQFGYRFENSIVLTDKGAEVLL